MRLLATIQARAVGFVDLAEMNPEGKIFFPQLAKEIAEQFQFLKSPRSFEDFGPDKAIEFAIGKVGDTPVDKLAVFGAGVLVETRVSSNASDMAMEQVLRWAATRGLNYRPGMIKKRGYVSSVFFESKVPLLTQINPAINRLAERVSMTTNHAELIGQSINYEMTGFEVGYDPTISKFTPAKFLLQRRNDTPFTENQYFAEAPLRTEDLLEHLKQFEAEVIQQLKA